MLVKKLDSEIYEHKQDFILNSSTILNEEELNLYYKFNKEFRLAPCTKPDRKDSLFTIDLPDPETKTISPFRVLKTVMTINGKKFDLEIKESQVSNREIIGNILTTQVLTVVLLFIGLILINRNLSKKIWKPFYEILFQLKKYQVDKKNNFTITHTDITEFQDLEEAIIHLINKNHQVFISQKEFTENAAHELQTPLAIFRNKLDLLMQADNLTSEQASIIQDLQQTADRLSRYKKNLLLLTKIDNQQFTEIEPVNIKQIITKIIDQYADQIHLKKIKLKIDLKDELTRKSNPSLLEIFFQNIITNAVKYTDADGIIEIISIDNDIHFLNSGKPLNDSQKIFSRFYRDNNRSQGSGLGLSIVLKISEVLNTPVRYTYDDGMHHFIINFPT